MATTDNLVKVGQLQTAMTRVKTELDTLDGKTFSSAGVSGGKINFYASTDHSGTALESIDLPEEISLDRTQTTFVQSFTFSSATYPGATNPNLDGKPVLVLAVKGDKTTNPTLSYSFINLESLIDTYTAGAGIAISDNTISVSVAGATQNNFVLFGTIVDNGFTYAQDSAISEMTGSDNDVVLGKHLESLATKSITAAIYLSAIYSGFEWGNKYSELNDFIGESISARKKFPLKFERESTNH